jgi:radical SAM protein with 4Fe4S-binding SPASM domain
VVGKVNLTLKKIAYKMMGSRLIYNPAYRWLLNSRIKSKVIPKLNVVMAETTNLCNLDCEFCFRKVIRRKQGIMSNGLAEHIINQCECDFSLQGCGEPFLDKDIFKKIVMVKNKGLKLFLSTNGTLLTEDIICRIVDSKLDILNVSIDADSDETYSKIHNCPKGTFDKIVVNVEKLIAIKKNKPAIELVFKIYDSNRGEEIGFLKRWNKGVKPLVALNIFKWYDTDFVDNIPTKRLMRFPCWFLWNTLFINWDGEVPLCCHDYDCKESLGNVNNTNLKDIFNGSKLQERRKQHLAGIYTSVCADCKINSQYVNPEWWWRC